MRGGKREGAGRPAMLKQHKRVQLSLSVSPEARDWLRDMAAEQGVNMGRVVEMCIAAFKDECEESR